MGRIVVWRQGSSLSTPPTDHESIKSYLLGQLAEGDVSQVEARLLTDREFYDELSIVEDDLIDRYLGGTLTDADRQSFESHFVSSSERQQKVRFARALRKYVSVAADQTEADGVADPVVAYPPESARIGSPSPPSFIFRKPLFSYAVAAVILLIAGASIFLFLKDRQSSTVTGRVLAIELTPAPAVRDIVEVTQVNLTPDVKTVRLQLNLPNNEYPSYEAVVRDSSFRTVLTTQNLKPQTINGFAAVIADVNANLLTPGDYRVQLSGTRVDGGSESVATFSFAVRR